MKKKIIRVTTVPFSMYTLLKGQLKYMKDNGYDMIAITSKGKEQNEIIKNEGVKMLTVDMTRSFTPLKDIKSLWCLYKIFKKEKPFIVHTQSPKAGIAGMLAARLARVPHRLHTVAGLPLMVSTGIKRIILEVVEKTTYKCATKVYPNSYGLYNFIIENKLAKEGKVKVIGKGATNGINTNYFSPDIFSNEFKIEKRKKLNILSTDFVFTFIGRIVEDKGVYELVRAFKALNNFTCKLVLVGEYEKDVNPLTKEIELEINENPNIIKTGFQKDIRPYLSITDCFVFPSYREGLPNVVMQAGAMKLTSIVTNITGSNEIIEDSYNGLIVEPKNEESLLRAMEYISNHPNEAFNMGVNARTVIKDRYEQSYVWKQILSEYNLLDNIK